MPGPGDKKDEGLKAPLGADELTTPLGPSEPPHAAAKLDLADPALRALRRRYDILAEAGRGAMGIVYRARDRETGAVVALKVLRPEIAADTAVIERFKSELLLARKITHKNVCRIYELLRFDDTVAIAMEFVEGESLRAILKRFGAVPLRRGLDWAKQICSALGEAHAQGIVHRDLKPENIFIDPRGQTKVMDFGIARSVETGATQTGSILGTPAYMSPEQAEGKVVDARSDIYALGLIFYEMFTGQAAFEAETPVSLALKQIHETPPSPRTVEPCVPLFLDRAIQRCLEKNPNKRFQSSAELTAALAEQREAIFSAVETAAKEAPSPHHLAVWQRRDWGLLGGALAGFVLFFILFDRVFPFGAVAPAMSRDEAINATKTIVEKYAPDLKGVPYTVEEGSYSDQLTRFPLEVLSGGLRSAIKALREGGPSWLVQQGAKGASNEVAYSNQGQPLSLRFALPSKDKMPKEFPSEQEVLPLATQAVEDLFGLRLAGVAPVSLTYDRQRDRWTYDRGWFGWQEGTTLRPVLWIVPDRIRETRTLVLVYALPGRLFFASAEAWRNWPLEWDWKMPERWQGAAMRGNLVLGVYCILCLVLSMTRRFYRQSSRMVWVASFVAAVASLGMFWRRLPEESEFNVVNEVLKVLACIVVLLLYYALLSVPYHYMLKTLPSQLNTLSALLKDGLRAGPAGLSILRGVCFGVLYLALHAGSLFVLGTLKLAATSGAWTEFLVVGHPSWEQVIWVLGLSFLVTVGATWLGVALPVSLLRRVTSRLWLVLAATGLLWTVAAASLPGSSAFPVLPLYLCSGLQGVFFAIIFWRYDLLTSMMTLLTIETWLLCYPPYRMFGGFEPWPYAATLFPWFLVALLGAILWLRPPVVAAWRRVTSVLE
jgi:hypothetical protein